MARLTAEQILARKLGQEEVDLGDGATVLVRGLNHNEAHQVNQRGDARERDVEMVHLGMVDPAMSREQVEAWFGSDGPGPLGKVSEAITRLSGLAPGQGKDATKSVPRRRGRG